jgi:hypothetical protein
MKFDERHDVNARMRPTKGGAMGRPLSNLGVWANLVLFAGVTMMRALVIALVPLVALTSSVRAGPAEVDQIAQETMIGLWKRDLLACMGEPQGRRALDHGTEIWTYPVGTTTSMTPIWALGLNFSAWAPPLLCDVRVVMTNAKVSQVDYGMPNGQALPSGLQCAFAVEPCARLRELK